jgi:transposase
VASVAAARRHDLSDAQWAVRAAVLPAGSGRGRPPGWTKRQILDGIRWRVRTETPRRDVPAVFPPWPTLYRWFRCWRQLGADPRVVADPRGRSRIDRLDGQRRLRPDPGELSMEQQAREQAFISALTTEQFVLQAARSANIGEMIGRGTVYMGTVSSALIAFGFLAQVTTRLDPFVAAVLPAVYLLGEFTFFALLRNTMENLLMLRKMQRIRGFYCTLVPEAEQFFGPTEEDERFTAAVATVGLRAWPAGMLFTGASVIAVINSIVGGVGSALLAAEVGDLRTGAALLIGITVAVVLFGLHLLYQQRQAGYLIRQSPAPSAS